MFSDSNGDCTGFISSWKFTRESEDAGVQTADLHTDDKEMQSRDCYAVGVQTDGEVTTGKASYDEARLAEFLGRVCPAVVRELDRVSRSKALAAYTLTCEEEEQEVQGVRVLQPPEGEGVKVSQLAWSCTGSTLAVALSHTLHTSWCSHRGFIHLYNVDRDSKTAGRTLEAASCVRTVSMHPYLASVVAVGTTSGEVVVWDVAKEGSEAALVNVTRVTHSEAVAQVRWVLGAGTAVMLASAALDGQLFLWKVSTQLASYQLLDRYKCGVSSGEPGISCFAFRHHQQDMFVVALEGGALVHCSTGAPRRPAVDTKEAVIDATVSSFQSQPATVTCVEFSPHHDDVFATVSTDYAIRIYSLFQSCVQRVLWGAEGLVGLSWHYTQADILATWGHSHSVLLYNAISGETLGALSPEPTNNQLSAVAFNYKSPRLLAVGDLDGVAQVWEIPIHVAKKPKTS